MKKNTFFRTLGRQIQLIKSSKMCSIYLYWPLIAIFGGCVPVIGVFYSKLIIECISEGKPKEYLILLIGILTGVSILAYFVSCILKAFTDV
ncbi:MAG: hypothetical protein K2N65_03355, partial [Anaeroplasmataceae bacterium]|nr:hypothetical protein [Anaeroplasmataceae bacterium]